MLRKLLAAYAALLLRYTGEPDLVLGTPTANRWHAELELGYGRFGDTTRPIQRRHKGPLRVQKHLYAEGPHVCQHIIVHPPGGIAGGDRLDISASVGPDAWAQLTSPGLSTARTPSWPTANRVRPAVSRAARALCAARVLAR